MHFMARFFSQDKIRRVVSDMEHKSWKRKNNTGVPEEVIHHLWGWRGSAAFYIFLYWRKTGIVKKVLPQDLAA